MADWLIYYTCLGLRHVYGKNDPRPLWIICVDGPCGNLMIWIKAALSFHGNVPFFQGCQRGLRLAKIFTK